MKKQLSFLLAFLLVLTSITPVFALESKDNSREKAENLVVEKTDALINLEDQVDGNLKDEEIVPVIISFNTDYFSHLGSPASIEELKTDAGKDAQVEFGKKVNKAALEMVRAKYPTFELLYELNLLTVGFTGYVDYKTAKELANEPYIKYIDIAVEYDAPARPEEMLYPMMSKSRDIVEANKLYSKYKGEKQVIAVLDSGTDLNHVAYYLSDGVEVALTEADITKLVAEKKIHAGKYHNNKIPFYYNYADSDLDVFDATEAGGMHGHHVAGTILGNKVTLADGSEFIGIAPEAQLLAMRVFSKVRGGTGAHIYVKAIEDAILLGAASVNMSLGSPAGNVSTVGKNVDEVLQKAANIGCIVAMAAGNESQFGYGVDNPDAHYPDYGIVGSPSVASLGLSVASMENTHMRQKQLRLYVDNKEIMACAYSPRGEAKFVPDKQYEYVYAGKGEVEDFKDLDLNGKVALMERGGNTFGEKVANAEEKNAIGAVIFNHESGGDAPVNMGFEKDPKIPAISIGHGAGLKFVENQANGKFAISLQDEMVINPESGMISEFSNWGLSAEGTFKPEILAPGGRIYSTLDGENFGDMSGTSMATPHVAGGIAIIRQRVEAEFGSLTGNEKYNLVKQLLMSTARPHVDKNKYISSPRHQGAGIMKLEAAANTRAILSAPGKNYCGVSLGDVDNSFSFDVEIKNITDETLNYKYYTNVTTDEVKDGRFTLAPRQLVKTDAQTITLGPKEVKTVKINVDVSDFAEELQTLMPNGYFIEGFVIFDSDSEVQISYPFVGFKGSWAELDVVEPSIYQLVKEGRLPFYYDKTGKTRDYTHFYGNVDGKQVIAGSVVDFDYADPKFEDVIVLSPNQDGRMDKITFVATALRNYRNIDMYLYDSIDGKPAEKGTKVFGSVLPGRKNHYSANKKWPKSEQFGSWYFDGKRSYDVLPDGQYFLASSAAPIITKAQQLDFYEIYIDTVAPDVKNTKANGNNVTFDIIEDGSGLRRTKVYYLENDVEKIIEANPDGSYTIPDGITFDKVLVEVEDKGYNLYKDTLDILLYEGSLGGLTVNIKADEGEPVVNYKVVKAEDETVEMNNLSRLPVGKYVLIVEDVFGYKNVTGTRVEFEITEENLNQTIELNFEKVQYGRLVTKINLPEGLTYDDVTIVAKDKLDPNSTYTLKQDDYLKSNFFALVPFGEYEIEVKVPEGYNASYIREVLVKNEIMEQPIAVNIVKGALAVIEVKSVFEDGTSHFVEYEVYDLKSGNTFPVGEIGNSSYLVNPVSVPEGYYADPSYIKVDVNNDLDNPLNVKVDVVDSIKHYTLTFAYKLQDGEGSLDVETVIKGNDQFTVEYLVKDFNAFEGLEGGKTYEDLTKIPYGNYFVVPKVETVNKNYTWLPKDQEISITKDNPKATTKFEFLDLRQSGLSGKVYFMPDIQTERKITEIEFEVKDADGKVILVHKWGLLDFTSWSVNLPYGYYEISPTNLPAGVVAEPAISEIRVDKATIYFDPIIKDEENAPTDTGKINVVFEDEKGVVVPGGEYTVEDFKTGQIYENGQLADGLYVVRVKTPPTGYELLGINSRSASISSFSKEVTVTFRVKKIGGTEPTPTGTSSIVLKFKVKYMDKDFVEGKDYKVEGVYTRELGDYTKVSDTLEGLEDGIKYVKLTWLNKGYEVDNFGKEYFFVNVKGPNTPLNVYLKEVTSPTEPTDPTEGANSIVLKFTANYMPIEFTEGKDYTVEGVYTSSLGTYTKISDKLDGIKDTGIYYVKLNWINPKYVLDKEYIFVYVSGPNSEARINVSEAKEAKLLVESVEDTIISVAYGTKLEDVKLPEKVKVKVKDSTEEFDVKVTWSLDKSDYQADVPGKYEIFGILDFDDLANQGLDNPDYKFPIAIVTVEEAPKADIVVKSAKKVKIDVAYGTKLEDINLPKTVVVKVKDSFNSVKEVAVKVNWDLVNNNYNKYTVGKYEIVGELDPKDLEKLGLTNPNNIKVIAEIKVNKIKHVKPVDKTKLIYEVDYANSLDIRAYASKTYNELVKLIEEANKIIASNTATQEEVDKIIKQIEEAIARLKKEYDGYSFPIDWHVFSPVEIVPVEKPVVKTPVVEKDYKNHWAQDVIELVVEKGYMDLDEKGNFNPEVRSNRLTIVKALALIENINPKDYMGESLKDVDANSIESGYINWARAKGIIDGYEDGTFKADRQITREEMAKILNKYVENLDKDRPVLEDKNFNDQNKIQDWAKEDVKKAVERGLMQGTDENKFEPRENITRAQVAQIIYNILN